MSTTALFAIAILAILIAWLCKHLSQSRGYLESLGMPVVKPTFLFGSGPFALHKVLMHEMTFEPFMKFNTLTYGRYSGVSPVVVTADPEIIKSVTIKNFDSFMDIFPSNVKIEDKHSTLDFVGGEVWRSLRKNLSPTFTSGRIKAMMEPMEAVADNMMKFLDDKFENNNGIFYAKEVFQGLTLDTIAQCAFGVVTDVYHDKDNELVKYGKGGFDDFRIKNMMEAIMGAVFDHFPGLLSYISIIPPKFDGFFEITSNIIKARQSQNIQGKKDFIARISEMIKQMKENPDSEQFKGLTEDTIIAQGIVFFLAGFDTTASSLATLCYHLAMNPEVQDKIYEEIVETLNEHDGKLNSDAIGSMEYLEAAINENLRIDSPVSFHVRICTKDCEIVPGMMIKEGTRLDLAIYGSHHHPKFFPDPEKFDPERFLPENKEKIIPYTYRPFGEGPRLCIGQRFAQMEMRLAIAKLLQKYRIVKTPQTKLKYETGFLVVLTFEEFSLKLEKR